MHTVQLKIDNSIYHNVMFILNNLKLKGLEIKEESLVEKKIDALDFSQYKVKAFKNIEDSVQWQESLRDEWGNKLKKYLLDTNSIIYALNSGFLFPKNKYYFSVITEIELLSFSKLTQEDSAILKSALSNVEYIGLSDDIKNETINIRKNNKIELPDSIIVASSLNENAILVTSDKQLLNSKLVQTIELKDLKHGK
jgi:predicted nucleic acid-binding protein